MPTLDILEEVSLFADLSMDELALIAPLAVMKEGKAGDFIIQEGECVESVYILLSGNATVMKTRGDGKKVSLDQVGKDDLLGEVTFFKNTPASASVQATARMLLAQAVVPKLCQIDHRTFVVGQLHITW